MEIKVVRDVLKANDSIAEENRRLLRSHGLRSLNLISSPGAGKTSLIEATIGQLPELRLGVIEGDIATTRDAERVATLGIPVVQITTRGACHLDASMVRSALTELPLSALDLVIIENVGNLVCPTSYDLGEDAKVVVISVPEGADKPIKYPEIIRRARLMVVNKLDLAPHCDCDLDAMERDARSIQPKLTSLRLSCRTGQGLEAWVEWLEEFRQG